MKRTFQPHRRRRKTVHGFRKFFKTQTEQVMKSINVEICMGHNIGVSKSYYKPSEKEILDDYWLISFIRSSTIIWLMLLMQRNKSSISSSYLVEHWEKDLKFVMKTYRAIKRILLFLKPMPILERYLKDTNHSMMTIKQSLKHLQKWDTQIELYLML